MDSNQDNPDIQNTQDDLPSDNNFALGKVALLIGQQNILPQAIKNRHLGEPNSYIYSGLAANRPTTGVKLTSAGLGCSIYFSTDTNVLNIWNGTAWQQFSTTNLSPTLTNAILNNPTINGSLQGVQTLTGTTPNIDLTGAYNIFTLTMSGNTTWTATTNTGKVFMVEVKQGAGTTYTNTWFAGITWVTSGATAPVQTATSNGYTTYGFRCTGANTYLGYLVGTN